MRLTEAPALDTPVSAAGLVIGDEVRQLDGSSLASPEDIASLMRRHKPGDAIAVAFVHHCNYST